MAISNNGKLLITVDADGFGLVINMQKQKVIEHYHFGGRVKCLTFSSCDQFVAVALKGSQKINIIKTPTVVNNKETGMSVVTKLEYPCTTDILGLQWTSDSKFVASWGGDQSAYVMSVDK